MHWSPSIGEELCCEVEEDNTFDRYAVAVTKDGRVVGHVPRELARLSEEAAQHDDLYSHRQEEAVGYQRKRPRSAVYLHFQRQRKACPETDILFHLATHLSTNPISISYAAVRIHTSFSKTILHTLVYAQHVHELQTAKPWAGRGERIREQKLTLSSIFALKGGGGGRNNEGGVTTREYGNQTLPGPHPPPSPEQST